MLFGINRPKGALSGRLARAYAGMFALVMLALSVMIFFTAYSFLIGKQTSNLITTMELTADHIIEEVHEGDSLTSREILEERNTSTDLNLYLRDPSGAVINRFINFHLDDTALVAQAQAPTLKFEEGDGMLLFYEQKLDDDGTALGTLYLVLNMQNERDFLKLLGTLLLLANGVGLGAALFAGRRTSRKMLAPINNMINDAQSIGSRSLGARLDVPQADDELKKLAITINGMLMRIENAFDAQGRFVADASHELRTPLAILQGNAELLARWGQRDEKVLEESIRSISRQTGYMNRLVENLLFLARADGDRRALQKETFLVGDLFRELEEEQALIDTAHSYFTQCDAKLELHADRSMVKQLLRVLLDNSIKYTDAGGRIGMYAETADHGIELSVQDAGIGMDAEYLEHIFDRFYRVDKARTRETGGMGLGLSIAAAIAQAHGGSIKAESEPGRGTRVTAFFPAI